MSPSTAGACSASGTKLGGIGTFATGTGAAAGLTPLCSASMTHLRSMLAFKPCASATAAIDTPGRRHSPITLALNSALCRRRRRRPIRSTP
jgi:hypothetical protein